MITKKEFKELITYIQDIDSELDRWDDFGISIWEMPIAEKTGRATDLAVTVLFNEEGADWINWWLYERSAMFEGEPNNKAYDEEGKEIPTETIDDLWNLVKEFRK